MQCGERFAKPVRDLIKIKARRLDLMHGYFMGCDLKEKVLSMDARVPRYTSYPTAPHFKPLDGSDTYEQSLKAIPSGEDLSLYVHVPFCPKLCWYCGCNTKVTKRYAPVEDYVHLVLREIDILSSTLGEDKRPVSHIHFGGGSPSYLRAVDFDLLMNKLRETFSIRDNAEIAIEVDPRNVSEGRVAAYARNGVNRISLGVQDFDETVLTSVNRQQPFHLSYEAVRLFREYGIEDINLDLIYGLPHQSCESMDRTVALAMTLKPSRVALFGYAHVPWMKKHMRLIEEGALPDKDLRYDLFETAGKALIEHGYEAVGIDHFARPEDTLTQASKDGTLHRNFQGYTTDTTRNMIGIGVSSIGKLEGMYVQNAPDMPVYKQAILAGHLPAQKFCPIAEEDRLRADIIERLMCDFSVDVATKCEAHGFSRSHLEHELSQLETYQTLGFLEIKGSRITLTPHARLMARNICSVFDSYLTQNSEQKRHSQAV
jgi:oxygen-independent coproporphyrinogen-3 oxidase